MQQSNPFDSCSEQYSKFRPEYPAELIDFIHRLCDGMLIDVGAGTGKASAPFVSRGLPVVSIEPSLPMIHQGIRTSPALHYVCATAENLPVRSGCASIVTCAQAFHWLDAPRTLHEFARVLKPGGHACIFWNTRDTILPAAQLLEELIHKWNPDHVLAYRRDDWGILIQQTGLFKDVAHHRYGQTVPMTIDDWIGLSRSISYIQSVGLEKIARFEEELRNGLNRVKSIDCSYITDLWCAEK
jgi:ubiquinone/menaquinone biosynthesis C-methylase UbiE